MFSSIRVLAFSLVAFLISSSPILAIEEFKDLKTIQLMPMTDAEVEFAHSRSRGETCELIGAGELMETCAFVMNLTDRDRRENARLPSSARHPLTSDSRKRLNYLSDYRPPRRQRDCSIHGSVVITDYDPSGIFPKTSATKSYDLNVARSYTMEELNQYCESQKLIDGLRKNLDTVLLAIAEHRIGDKQVPGKLK